MDCRIPSTILIFIGDAWYARKPRFLSRVPPALKNSISHLNVPVTSAYPNAVIEEVRQARLKAEHTDGDPILQALVVTESARDIPVALDTIQLARSELPGGPETTKLLCLGDFNEEDIPANQVRAFFAAKNWRGRRPDRSAGDALLLAFTCTEISRLQREGFRCFDSVRFGAEMGSYRIAIDHWTLPDCNKDADAQLSAAASWHFFPLLSGPARRALADRSVDVSFSLSRTGPHQLLMLETAEPLLYSALAVSDSLERGAGLLREWALRASPDMKRVLLELELAVLHYRTELTTIDVTADAMELASEIFVNSGCPMIHKLPLNVEFANPHRAWETAKKEVAGKLVEQRRRAIDDEYYRTVPHDSSLRQIQCRLGELSGLRVAVPPYVTRHFPRAFLRDSREEVMAIPDIAITAYIMRT